MDYGRDDPAIDPVFRNVDNSNYWSSTAHNAYGGTKWIIHFGESNLVSDHNTNGQFVRCVRSKKITIMSIDRFSRNKDIVIDRQTGLQWQDDKEAKTIEKNWREAIQYCEDLTLAGYNDWRLPNVRELLSITDKSRYDPAIQSIFKNVYDFNYVSSSLMVRNNSYPWVVDFDYGVSGELYSQSFSLYVRCVG